jgi:hypothetical protein
MKLNLKEALYKYYILTEGWMENLSEKYSEDVLIFVGRMLQQAYPGENIANHPLAEWLAKTAKSLGEMPWNESNRQKNEDSFQEILAFVKSKDDSKEIINKIKSLSAKDAIKYVDEFKEEDGAFDEIKQMENAGLIRVIEKIGDKVWVEVLSTQFFKTTCKNNSNFGVACQINSGPFVGGDRNSFSLLGKVKEGDKSFYITLVAISTVGGNRFYEIKQPGNAFPGAQNVGKYTGDEIANETIKFITTNPKVNNITKYVDFFNINTIPTQEVRYGGGGTFSWWLKNKPQLITKIIEKNPDVLNDMEPLIRNVNPQFLELVNVNIADLVQEDPVRFFNRLNIYLSVNRQEVVDVLNNFDYENFIQNYPEGLRSLEKSLLTIIDLIPYETFKNKIKNFTDFPAFLSKLSESDIKDIVRKIRNKFDKNTKAFTTEFNVLLPDFISGLGGGSSAFAKIFNILNTPRLDTHQNYTVDKEGNISAMVEVPVVRDGRRVRDSSGRDVTEILNKNIPEEEQILGKKLTKALLKNNKDSIMELMYGSNESEKQLNYIKLLLKNMSQQERDLLLKDKKEELISKFNQLYESNKEKYVPGFIAYNFLKNDTTYSLGGSFLSTFLENRFPKNTSFYVFEKKDFRENINNLMSFYYGKSINKEKNKKIIDGIIGMLVNAINSKFSNEEINQIIFEQKSPLKMKNLTFNDIHYFTNSVLALNRNDEFKLSANSLINFLKSDKVREIVNKEGKGFGSTIIEKYKELLKSAEIIANLNESYIRKYIQKLLESNFSKKNK